MPGLSNRYRICLLCGADKQPVLIPVLAAGLKVFLVSQASRRAGTFLYICLLCGADTQLGRDWRWSGGAHEDPVYRTILAKFQDNKETTLATTSIVKNILVNRIHLLSSVEDPDPQDPYVFRLLDPDPDSDP
jgi:hypothetical protein